MAIKCPIIQRLPCAIHKDRVAAICYQCHELAERQRDVQWAKERKAAHQDYLKRVHQASA